MGRGSPGPPQRSASTGNTSRTPSPLVPRAAPVRQRACPTGARPHSRRVEPDEPKLNAQLVLPYGHLLGFGHHPIGHQLAIAGDGSLPARISHATAHLKAVLGLDRPGDPMLTAIHVDRPEFPSKGCAYAYRQVQLEAL